MSYGTNVLVQKSFLYEFWKKKKSNNVVAAASLKVNVIIASKFAILYILKGPAKIH